MHRKDTDNTGRTFEDTLARLQETLENEHRALLDGDPKAVTAIATEKERLSEELQAHREALPNDSRFSDEVKDLAKRVEELAQLNHILIGQMYQQYNGMVELLMRLSGQARTYGKNGMITLEPKMLKDAQILA